MPKAKAPTLTLDQKKARAYDLIAQRELIDQQLNEINQQIFNELNKDNGKVPEDHKPKRK